MRAQSGDSIVNSGPYNSTCRATIFVRAALSAVLVVGLVASCSQGSRETKSSIGRPGPDQEFERAVQRTLDSRTLKFQVVVQGLNGNTPARTIEVDPNGLRETRGDNAWRSVSIVVDGSRYESVGSCPDRFVQETANLDEAIAMSLSDITILLDARDIEKDGNEFAFTLANSEMGPGASGTAEVSSDHLSVVKVHSSGPADPSLEYRFDWSSPFQAVQPPDNETVFPPHTDPEDAYAECAA